MNAQVPSSISNLAALTYLDICKIQKLEPGEPDALISMPVSISALSRLRELAITADRCPAALPCLEPFLTRLKVNGMLYILQNTFEYSRSNDCWW